MGRDERVLMLHRGGVPEFTSVPQVLWITAMLLALGVLLVVSAFGGSRG
jgi:hypothetical protein